MTDLAQAFKQPVGKRGDWARNHVDRSFKGRPLAAPPKTEEGRAAQRELEQKRLAMLNHINGWFRHTSAGMDVLASHELDRLSEVIDSVDEFKTNDAPKQNWIVRFMEKDLRMNDVIKLDQLPDLASYEIDSVDLVPDYWTPEDSGESRRLFFYKIEEQQVPDFNDPDKMTALECAVFVEPIETGHRTVVNGSKRLVAAVENLTPGTPLQITYIGKKKNRQNSNESDHWSIVTLAVPKGGDS